MLSINLLSYDTRCKAYTRLSFCLQVTAGRGDGAGLRVGGSYTCECFVAESVLDVVIDVI